MSKKARVEKDRRRHYEIGRDWSEAYLLRSGAKSVERPAHNFLKGDNGHGIHIYTRLHDDPTRPYEDSQVSSMDVERDKKIYKCNFVEVVLVRTYELGEVYQKGLCYLVRVPRNIVETGKINIQFTHEFIQRSECEFIPLDPLHFMKKVSSITLSPEEEAYIAEVDRGTSDLSDTERKQVIRARVGQSLFKEKLLKRTQQCEYCGLTNIKLLTASHIKDWSACETKLERLDSDNGLLLCPNHDKAFDLKMFSFDEAGFPLISAQLSAGDLMFLNIDTNRKIALTIEQQIYMTWHRKACGLCN